jgi:outer membrane protein TolC
MAHRRRVGPSRRAALLTLLLGTTGPGAGPAPVAPAIAPPVPLPLPLPTPDPRPATSPGPQADPTSMRAGGPLAADQPIQPIDLVSTLRLAGARNLDIAIARERVGQALAELEQARVLWLPSLFLGPNWIRHDGQVQTVEGQVKTTSKSSLFLGGTAAAGSSVSGPIPAGGPAQVSGLTSILRISDAIFTPLAAQQVVRARQAGVQAATNDVLLEVSEAYFDIQLAAGRLVVAREAAENAETLVALSASFARSGAGLEADHRRSLAERDKRRRDLAESVGELEVASAELIRLLHLDPRIVVAPVEPPVALIRLIGDGTPIDDLITTGLHHRPELAEAQALVQATLLRLKEAKLRPFIPSLALRYSGGGFGGGINSFFGGFNSRSDADVNLYWELQNLGFADRAIARSRAAQQRAAVLELMKVQDRVASEVVRAEKTRLAAVRQLDEAGRAIPEALTSLSLNLANIRRGSGLPGATRPIEVLQPIQALAQARLDYLNAVLTYNRAQFRLFRALGQPPLLADAPSCPPTPPPSATPPKPP